ncbi:hypothetical protein HYH03_016469 [Edaphochlamys debaryana]|uniref:DJ-1/PfpI domain-containing protein n=1 Tax=Edaphochlamys debaryana TaxID=47281 RepID=A0A836BQ77_9CHLO|nr:hypothetical protein HYH03_016469 [Edaphochlamys debaryana]|eukprot:KAG2484722.1 hypothetical protein HYH03_016469 [Edaphochlamys debaryana]
MTAKRVLIMCTSANKLKDVDTGCWAEEVCAPFYIWKKHGITATIGSIKGGEVPMDDASLNPPFLTKEVEEFLLDDEAMKGLTESVPLADAKVADYDAIFLPGGHGCVADFPDNAALIKLVEEFAAAGKVVAAVCHGPNGLVNVKGPDGKPLVAGKKVTGFSNAEEYAVAKENLVPFMLEDKLKELGGKFEMAKEKWASHAVVDGKLATGQNPGSSIAVAELVAKLLS